MEKHVDKQVIKSVDLMSTAPTTLLYVLGPERLTHWDLFAKLSEMRKLQWDQAGSLDTDESLLRIFYNSSNYIYTFDKSSTVFMQSKLSKFERFLNFIIDSQSSYCRNLYLQNLGFLT